MHAPVLGVSTVSSPGIAVVTAAGEIDLDTASQLREALAGCLVEAPAWIRVDLREVGFCDCSGLNVLLWARARAMEIGIRLGVVAAAGSIVLRVLQLTGTDRLLLEEDQWHRRQTGQPLNR